jgi:hypothetical protein
MLMQGVEHQAVAAESQNHVTLFRWYEAIDVSEFSKTFLCRL